MSNENLSGAFDQEEYEAMQDALPIHKRDGYAERIYEMADQLRDELKFEQLFRSVE